jgi:hypothetical protein
MPAKNSQDANRVQPIGPDEFVSMGDAIAHILTELGLARVRHRALIATLVDAGVISWEAYVENYMRTATRDAAGLTSQLILTPEAFKKRFGAWKRADVDRYKVMRQAAGDKVGPPAKKRKSP